MNEEKMRKNCSKGKSIAPLHLISEFELITSIKILEIENHKETLKCDHRINQGEMNITKAVL